MNIVTQFLSFDKLMGQSLVKIVYFLGLIGIAFGCLGILSWSMFLGGAGGLLGGIVSAVIFAAIAVCFLRFTCELYITLFRMGEDIRAMRGAGATLPPKT